MKKLFAIMTALFMTVPAMANEYGGQTPRRDNYIGVRLHKNDNLARSC